MAAIFSFRCSCCGNVHEGSPSFGFRAPDTYLQQSEDAQKAGHLNSDLCSYADEDGTHYFVRACLEIPIHGVTEPFVWGVWVSLSDASYTRCTETFDDPVEADSYFGWLCNGLPYYENRTHIKTRVHPRRENKRPYVVPEQSEEPVSVDFHRGISIELAQEIAELIMHR